MFYLGLPQFEHFLSLPFYSSGLGHFELQPPVYRPEGFGRHQFLYCEHGSGTITINGVKAAFPANHGIYLPANLPHEYYANENIWDIRWIACGGSGVTELCSFLDIPAGTVLPINSCLLYTSPSPRDS